MKKILLSVIFLAIILPVFSQNTLMTIGNKKISADEFEYIYNKNNSAQVGKKTIDEYMELFKNFKIKVVEAERLKLDTAQSFISELNGYKEQLAKPYLTENIKIKELVKEAYERSNKDVKLDVIFIRIDKQASPEDTLVAYNKAIKIKNRIKSGEDFEKVVEETSDDRGAARNKGHLSYIPVSKVPYSLQNYIFNAKRGELSNPIRTKFGYYLLKVIDIRTSPGEVKVAHIMMTVPKDNNEKDPVKKKAELEKTNKEKKARIDSIYKALKKGTDFKELVKLSDDKGTAKKAGELPWFGTGRMVPEFETAAFALKNKGDFSKPIKTSFGWHIIKLIDKRGNKTFKEKEKELKTQIERDPERMEIVRNFATNKLKKDFNFKKLNSPSSLNTAIDSSIFKGKWSSKNKDIGSSNLFKANNKNYTEKDFAQYIENNQKRMRPIAFETLINEKFKEFVYYTLVEIEKSKLPTKYPDYRNLINEYHDGILIFELTKQEVWDKASNDSIGLEKFYNANKDKYSKSLELDMSIFKCTKEKAFKKATKLLSKKRSKFNDEKLVAKMLGTDENFSLIKRGKFSKGEDINANKVFDMIASKKISENDKVIPIKDSNLLIYINDKKTSNKKFEDIKGIVIADYQNDIEKRWIEKLKRKHKIKINDKVLNKIKKNIK